MDIFDLLFKATSSVFGSCPSGPLEAAEWQRKRNAQNWAKWEVDYAREKEKYDHHPYILKRETFYKQLRDQGFKERSYFSNEFSDSSLFPSADGNNRMTGTVIIFQTSSGYTGRPGELTVVIPGHNLSLASPSEVRLQFSMTNDDGSRVSGEVTFQQYLNGHPSAAPLLDFVGPLEGRSVHRPKATVAASAPVAVY